MNTIHFLLFKKVVFICVSHNKKAILPNLACNSIDNKSEFYNILYNLETFFIRLNSLTFVVVQHNLYNSAEKRESECYSE